MRWSEYRDHLPPGQQHGLVRAVRIGHAEAQQAVTIVLRDGELHELRDRLDTAIMWLTEARQALDG